MKIIQSAARREIANYVCDKCKKEAVSHLEFSFGYGSNHDMTKIDLDFCEKCEKEILKMLSKQVKINFKEIS